MVIACAGVVGAVLRYVVGRLLPTPSGHFPWGTFWINISGSLVIGLVLVLLNERFPRARVARPLIATGFLGAFTTFSTFMVDTDLLVQARRFEVAAIYAGASLVAGVTAALTGVVLARFFIGLDHRLNEQLGS